MVNLIGNIIFGFKEVFIVDSSIRFYSVYFFFFWFSVKNFFVIIRILVIKVGDILWFMI